MQEHGWAGGERSGCLVWHCSTTPFFSLFTATEDVSCFSWQQVLVLFSCKSSKISAGLGAPVIHSSSALLF